MPTIIGVGVAGALGALARYALDGRFARDPHHVPWVTFAINISGSFLLGVIVAHLDAHPLRESWLRPTLTIGLLGAYTTFSTLSLETYRLVVRGHFAVGLAYASGTLAIGLAAVTAGVALGRVV
jgi:fluoride exporter